MHLLLVSQQSQQPLVQVLVQPLVEVLYGALLVLQTSQKTLELELEPELVGEPPQQARVLPVAPTQLQTTQALLVVWDSHGSSSRIETS